ncbi:MAG: TatD family hydrolase [Thermodesulfobacteriota bacterium]
MNFFDSHLHHQAISNSVMAGVGQFTAAAMFCNSAKLSDWPQVLAKAHTYPQVVLPFLGIHPWFAGEWNGTSHEQLAHLLATEQARGIGEIGLDRPCGVAAHLQEQAFMAQLQLAGEFSCPVAIHCVRRWGRLLEILADHSALPAIMIHGFTGSLEVMVRLLSLGCYISFGPKLMARDGGEVSTLLGHIPLERLLLESDAPHMADGNYPAELLHLINFCAQLRDLTPEELGKIIYENGKVFTN